MAERRPVVVIGAGVGGLAVAIRLAAVGHRVVVLERNGTVGGKLAARRHDGFTFDVGPSLLTLPARVRRAVRRRPGRRWPPRSTSSASTRSSTTTGPTVPTLVVPDDRDGDGGRVRALRARRRRGVAALRRARPADLGRQRALVLRRPDGRSRGSCCGGCARPPISSPSIRCARCTAAPRTTSPTPGSCSGPVATPPTPARRRTGRRPRWRASRTSSRASAAGTRAAGWTRCGRRCSGVAVALGVDVRVGRRGRCAIAAGRRCRHRRRARRRHARWRRPSSSPTPTPSTSTATCCPTTGAAAGAAGRAVDERVRPRSPPSAVGRPGIGHHNVWFAGDDRAEFADLEAGRMADDPTIYACVSSGHRSDAGAGRRRELVPARQHAGRHRPRRRRRGRPACSTGSRRAASTCAAASRGRTTITPADLAARYRSPGGAIYGTSSNGRRAAFLRPGNRGAVARAVPRRRIQPPRRRAAARGDERPHRRRR